MQSQTKLSLLHRILQALGLSAEAVDDIIARILDFLSPSDDKAPAQAEFPYLVRDDFLSPAEQSFYLVLKSAVSEWALICPKVALGDLFYATSSDPSRYRTFTNRIDASMSTFFCASQGPSSRYWESNSTTRVIGGRTGKSEMNWFSRCFRRQGCLW